MKLYFKSLMWVLLTVIAVALLPIVIGFIAALVPFIIPIGVLVLLLLVPYFVARVICRIKYGKW